MDVDSCVDNKHPITIGLDLGACSVGWAIATGRSGCKKRIIRAGAHIFETPYNSKTGQTTKSIRALQKGRRNLLDNSQKRIKDLSEVWEWKFPKYSSENKEYCSKSGCREGFQYGLCSKHNPWLLRERAVRGQVSLEQMAIIWQHMAKLRGFLSNSLASDKEKEENSKIVLPAIERFKAGVGCSSCSKMKQRNISLYPGAHAVHLLAKASGAHSRNRAGGEKWYYGRSDVMAEFEQIWQIQSELYPNDMTPELKEGVKKAIFKQKSVSWRQNYSATYLQDGLSETSALRCLPSYQNMHILEQLRNVLVQDQSCDPQEIRVLTENEIDKLFNELQETEALGIAGLKKELGKNLVFYQHNKDFDNSKSLKIYGNQTNVGENGLKEILGEDFEKFKKLNIKKQDVIINKLWELKDPVPVWNDEQTKAKERLRWLKDQDWLTELQLSEEALDNLASYRPSAGRTPFTEKQISVLFEKLRPELDSTDSDKIYPHARVSLMSVIDSEEWQRRPIRLDEITNPIVHKTVRTAQNIVDFIYNNYDYRANPKNPYCIAEVVIESGRELGWSAKRKKSEAERQSKYQETNEAAKKALQENSISVTSQNILKFKLWNELPKGDSGEAGERIELYKGEGIKLKELVSAEIEHINGRAQGGMFDNLTLTTRQVNSEKGDKKARDYIIETGLQDAMARLDRSKFTASKKENFLFGELNGTGSVLLNSNAHAAQALKDILKTEYEEQNIKTLTIKPQTLAIFRRALGLNSLLATEALLKSNCQLEKNQKQRWDNRHHVIDAILAGLLSDGEITNMENYYRDKPKNIKFGKITAKFDDNKLIVFPPLGEDVSNGLKNFLNNIEVTHEVVNKPKGALHKETIYRNSECHKKSGGWSAKSIKLVTIKDLGEKYTNWIKKNKKETSEPLFQKISDSNDAEAKVAIEEFFKKLYNLKLLTELSKENISVLQKYGEDVNKYKEELKRLEESKKEKVRENEVEAVEAAKQAISKHKETQPKLYILNKNGKTIGRVTLRSSKLDNLVPVRKTPGGDEHYCRPGNNFCSQISPSVDKKNGKTKYKISAISLFDYMKLVAVANGQSKGINVYRGSIICRKEEESFKKYWVNQFSKTKICGVPINEILLEKRQDKVGELGGYQNNKFNAEKRPEATNELGQKEKKNNEAVHLAILNEKLDNSLEFTASKYVDSLASLTQDGCWTVVEQKLGRAIGYPHRVDDGVSLY